MDAIVTWKLYFLYSTVDFSKMTAGTGKFMSLDKIPLNFTCTLLLNEETSHFAGKCYNEKKRTKMTVL